MCVFDLANTKILFASILNLSRKAFSISLRFWAFVCFNFSHSIFLIFKFVLATYIDLYKHFKKKRRKEKTSNNKLWMLRNLEAREAKVFLINFFSHFSNWKQSFFFPLPFFSLRYSSLFILHVSYQFCLKSTFFVAFVLFFLKSKHLLEISFSK